GQELKCGTQPCNPDTDNDNLPDGTEVCLGTNPCNPDTDLDGLFDGREVGLGLDPLSVDTDCDGIADSDEVEYQLLGMSVAEKESSEIARRLRNWLPTDIEDLESDIDNDGTPDWVEYLGGGEPGEEFDVFEGTDGFPSVYVMTVNVEVNNLQRPLMLECNGEKVCVNRSCSIQRFCEEGTWHNLRVVGVQGASVKVNVDYDDPRYSQALVVAEDPQNMNGCTSLPADSFPGQHVCGELRFCQPTVEIVNEYICFHGTGMNPQTKKTVSARIVPEDFLGEFTWWTGNGLEHDENDEVEGEDANILRDCAGSDVFCAVRFMMDDRIADAVRVTHKPVTECTHKDTDAEQAEWCDTHNREKRRCHEKHVMDCSHTWEDSTVVKDLPRKIPAGSGTGGGDDIVHEGFETPTDDGSPYYENKYAYLSIPVNNDDDNLNEKPDAEEKGKKVDSEDDYRIVPLAPGHEKCCPCHKCSRKVVVDEIKGDITLWLDESKDKEVSNTSYNIHQKVYVEGLKPSTSPNDASFVCIPEPEGESEEQERITHSFTVYSLRLQPDLNADNRIDIEDAKLVKDMKSLGLGWCVSPGKLYPLKLNVDVDMPGTVYMKVNVASANGDVKVYSSASCSMLDWMDPQSAYKGEVTEVAGYGVAYKELCSSASPASASQVLWLEVSDHGVIGTIEVVYEGTGDAEGYECHAKIKFQSLDFRIAGDGDVRDGEINFDDPADTNIVFWVNDDYDVLHDHEGMWQEDDDDKLLNKRKNCDDDVIGAIPGEGGISENSAVDQYNSDRTVYCFRDLEDFDRLHVKMGSELVDCGGTLAVEVRMDSVGKPGEGVPAVNLFEAVGEDLFYLRHGKEDWGTERGRLEAQMKKTRLATADGGKNWNRLEFENYITFINGRLCFLYEGKTCGKGILRIRVRVGDLVLAESSLRMDIHKVDDLVDTYEIPETTATNSADIDEFQLTVDGVEGRRAKAEIPGTTDKDLVLLTLGWNVAPFEKLAWRDTVFKRLFWQGYRGRVGTLIWPTTYGFNVDFGSCVKADFRSCADLDFKRCFKGGVVDWEVFGRSVKSLADAPNYDRGEHRAWLSGVRAAEYFSKEIPKFSHVTFLVHSQGNILMGEMLRRLPLDVKGKITYIALQGAVSAQLYTREFMPQDANDSWNMQAFGVSGALDWTGRWLTDIREEMSCERESPDIFGHYPYGRDGDKPYFNDVLEGLWHTMNYYNRRDYALNVWLGNNGTKPDNLKGRGENDRSFGFTTGSLYGYTLENFWQSSGMHPGSLERMWMSNGENGRFYQNRSGMKLAIYPGEDEDRTGDEAWKYEHPAEDGNSGAERAKWCVFSFVTRAKSLAIGQLPMSGFFKNNANLEGGFSCGSDHYYHSWEFRSNCWRTSPLWTDILHHIKKEPDGKTK
ncbi:MAG: hypothetical protein MJ249_07200, partial [Kiritimatiellae bacterium]|nr:hypothetical protein [Kiritimatiellia bacterium]